MSGDINAAAEQELSFDQQMANVSLITRLWIHYFVEDHPGDAKDCTEPGCAAVAEELRGER